MPTEEKAKSIILEFENLMIKVLKNCRDNVKGRIVFTAPLIRTGKKRISCNFGKIAKETGLSILSGPVPEFRKDSIVGRSILIMGK